MLQAQVFLASEKARNQKQDQKQAQQEEFMDVEEGNSNGITIKEGKLRNMATFEYIG